MAARSTRQQSTTPLSTLDQHLAYLKLSFIADYIVLGGGNAKQFETLRKGIEPGHNRNAYQGGLRMWETDPKTRRPKWNVI